VTTTEFFEHRVSAVNLCVDGNKNVAGMQLQIGVPNTDLERYTDIRTLTAMGKVDPPDNCPGKFTFGIPVLSYVSEITLFYSK